MRLTSLVCASATLFGAGLAPAEILPLPSTVIAFDSPEGETLFARAKARQD